MRKWLAALPLVCALSGAMTPGVAGAVQWLQTAKTDRYTLDIDLASAEVRQEIVKVWVRETHNDPVTDQATSLSYTTEVTQTSEDCDRRQYALGDRVRSDKSGKTVQSGPAGGSWKPIVPGSVGEGTWRVACAISHPPKEKAFAEVIGGDSWKRMGVAEDKKYVLWINTADLVKVDGDMVLMLTRSDYTPPRPNNGFRILYEVTAAVTDCKNEKYAFLGSDFYAAPNLRVGATRIARDEMKFVPVAPATFLGSYMKQICGSARPLQAKGAPPKDSNAEQTAFYTGTAWGAEKGYLVTAAHVIEGAKAIDVYRDGDKVGEAKVVVADFANDLAILAFTKAPAGKLKVLPMALHGPALGRGVFTLGYPAPGILGQQVKMTAGQVNSTAGLQDDTRMLQISIPVQGGNSGGPVMSWDGAVVGIVDSKLNRLDKDDHERPQNINYAVKSSYLRPMFEELPDLGNHEAVKIGPTQEKTVAAVREAVFMLLVATDRKPEGER